MSETGTRKEECRFCFTALAYLMDGCPVCGGTGFVEVKAPEKEPKLDLRPPPGLPLERHV
jgi:hypothetical protein